MLKVAKKYVLALPKENSDTVSKVISEQGCFEIADNNQEVDVEKELIKKRLQKTEYYIATVNFAISYLAPFTPKISFLEKIRKPKILLAKESLKTIIKPAAVFDLAKRVEKIEEKLDVLLREKKEAQIRLQEIEKFGDLNFIPQDTEYTFSLSVIFTQSQAERFISLCLKHKFYQREISQTESKVVFLSVGLKEEREKILQIIKELKGEILPYNFPQPPLKERQNIAEKTAEIDKKITAMNQELSIIAKDLPDFKIYYDFLMLKKTDLEIKSKILSKNFLNYIVFWGYEKEKELLQKRISKINKEIIVLEITPEAKEEAPVCLENNKFLEPFQYVTEIFGMPRAKEIDPTPYLALFFILFFGTCLTDAGYGGLLIIFTLLPLFFLKNMISETKLLKLLFYGGISTVIMGILFGSYFGVSVKTLEKIPFLFKLKRIDPIEDTVLFMMLSFGVGYLQVAFAQIIKIILGRKNKNKEMLLNGAAWLSFYLFSALLIASRFFPALKTISLPCVVGSLVFLMFVESMGQKMFLKPLVGLIKILQGLIATMSDVLSYSRLVALGLATAVIALIVNQIAFLLGGMIPYVGWLITGLVLMGGHIFNLGINALGAFIHSGRLQFVEFFPKFLEGGGRRFKPTKSNLKYIQLNLNNAI